eukprot:986343_1
MAADPDADTTTSHVEAPKDKEAFLGVSFDQFWHIYQVHHNNVETAELVLPRDPTLEQFRPDAIEKEQFKLIDAIVPGRVAHGMATAFSRGDPCMWIDRFMDLFYLMNVSIDQGKRDTELVPILVGTEQILRHYRQAIAIEDAAEKQTELDSVTDEMITLYDRYPPFLSRYERLTKYYDQIKRHRVPVTDPVALKHGGWVWKAVQEEQVKVAIDKLIDFVKLVRDNEVKDIDGFLKKSRIKLDEESSWATDKQKAQFTKRLKMRFIPLEK